jgi:hypothetical protein
MKKIAILTLALIMALSLAACGGGSSEKNKIANETNEAWVNDEIKMSYVFYSDGTYKSYSGDPWKFNGSGEYKLDGTSVSIDGKDNTFTLDGDTLKTAAGTVYKKTTPFALNTGNSVGTKSGGREIGDISAGNWTDVIKDNFDLELSLPSGWTVKDASSPDGKVGTKIIFTVSGDTTPAAFGEIVFNTAKAVTKRDMTAVTSSDIISTFADAHNAAAEMVSFKYCPLEDANISDIIVNIFYSETQVELGITGNLQYIAARNS